MVKRSRQFVLCIANAGYAALLEVRKVYQTLPDPDAASEGLCRVIDESGEDYLYPESLFAPLTLPPKAKKAFAAA